MTDPGETFGFMVANPCQERRWRGSMGHLARAGERRGCCAVPFPSSGYAPGPAVKRKDAVAKRSPFRIE
jgi:hypothetical protein